MTPDDRAHMEELCARIAVERDHRKFLELVKQLNEVLERSHGRLINTDGASRSKFS